MLKGMPFERNISSPRCHATTTVHHNSINLSFSQFSNSLFSSACTSLSWFSAILFIFGPLRSSFALGRTSTSDLDTGTLCCLLQHWCVNLFFFMNALAFPFCHSPSVSPLFDTHSHSFSPPHTHTHSVSPSPHSYYHVDRDDSWNHSLTGWLSSTILPPSFQCLHLALSPCQPISNHYLRVRAFSISIPGWLCFTVHKTTQYTLTGKKCFVYANRFLAHLSNLPV